MSADRREVRLPVSYLIDVKDGFFKRQTVDCGIPFDDNQKQFHDDTGVGEMRAAMVTGENVLNHMIREKILGPNKDYTWQHHKNNPRAPYDFTATLRDHKGLFADAKYRARSFVGIGFGMHADDFLIHLNFKTQVPDKSQYTPAEYKDRCSRTFICEVLNGGKKRDKDNRMVFRYYVTTVSLVTLLAAIDLKDAESMILPTGTPGTEQATRVVVPDVVVDLKKHRPPSMFKRQREETLPDTLDIDAMFTKNKPRYKFK